MPGPFSTANFPRLLKFSNKFLIFNELSVCRKEKETQWIKTEDQLNENSIVVRGLEPGLTYQFRVVAVDGQFQTPSR